MAETTLNENLDFNKVWLMFQENKEQLKQTREILDKKFQDTDKKFQETDKKFQETREILDEKFQETRELMDTLSMQTDKKLNKLEGTFTSRWGKFIEALVNGDLVSLLKERNIDVRKTSQRIECKYNNRQYEFDIIAENGEDVVVVEVKTTLRVKDVKEFILEMKDFKKIVGAYEDKNIYGAIAFLHNDEESASFALKKGLFVIKATGKSAIIINPIDFKLRKF